MEKLARAYLKVTGFHFNPYHRLAPVSNIEMAEKITVFDIQCNNIGYKHTLGSLWVVYILIWIHRTSPDQARDLN